MKNFIEKLKEKDQKIINSNANNELISLEKISYNLEDQHDQIKRDISNIDNILDFIAKHQIEAGTTKKKFKNRSEFKKWIKELKETFKSIHLIPDNELTPKQVELIKIEKSKLLTEKKRLTKEEHHINILLAKANVYLMNTREGICKEFTKGHSIADVGEKLLVYFGKEMDTKTTYNDGRRKVIHFLESSFQMDRVDAQTLFSILEKSRVLIYKIDLSNVNTFSYYDDFDGFTDSKYSPLYGDWYVNT